MNISIQFNPDGTAHCLWTDAISLHELGHLEITRAGQIEFHNADQKWEVIDGKGSADSSPGRVQLAWNGNKGICSRSTLYREASRSSVP